MFVLRSDVFKRSVMIISSKMLNGTLTPVNNLEEGAKKCWHQRKGSVATSK